MTQESTHKSQILPTTQWDVVNSIHRGTEIGPDLEQQINDLISPYYPVLNEVALYRMRIKDPDVREELVQRFMANTLGNYRLLHQAKESKGRLRTYITIAFINHIKNYWRTAQKAKIELSDKHMAVLEAASAGDIFEKEWLSELLQLAHERLVYQCEALGQTRWLAVWHARHADEPHSFDSIAEGLGVSRSAVQGYYKKISELMFVVTDKLVQEKAGPDPCKRKELKRELFRIAGG